MAKGGWALLRYRRQNMARITVEDCLRKVNNRFAVIHLAAKRVRQLRKGAEPLVVSKNKDIVIALREIAAGKVYPMSEEELAELEQALSQEIIPELPVPGDQAETPDEDSDASAEENAEDAGDKETASIEN